MAAPCPGHGTGLRSWPGGGQGTPRCVRRSTRPEVPVRTGGASLSGPPMQAAGVGPKQSGPRPGPGPDPQGTRSPRRLSRLSHRGTLRDQAGT
ncbi:hypothetical protein NDU88_002124 [Pleurodeles waltl]|uniref:Uncharacterized protein n=1 Tax=Pleurodeles waltl TaxID=8319 RepID=A0AAV7RDL5_PLEWA|nr:hypothetical protein NDU88_002124 [Pleurodeles waltl]